MLCLIERLVRFGLPTIALLLAGCAIAPTYSYVANNGAGYYHGQSPYGDADVVVRGAYVAPAWGYWGPAWGWGSGWYGYGGVSVGTVFFY